MPEQSKPPSDRYRLWPGSGRAVAAICTIAVIVAVIVAGFAYAGGLLSPGRLTQAKLIDTFEQVNGVHPGFRRNHTKGVCIAGYFDSNGNGAELSRASVFERGRVPVTGRFAVAVGKPFVPDNETEVRSMALSFRPAGGEEWRTGMNDIPVFPVSTPKEFWELLVANTPDPATGKPDPARLKAFFAANPDAARAVKAIKSRPFSSGFANADYNSLDAFRLVNRAGVSTPVRWSMKASDAFAAETPQQAATQDKNYLFDALIARLRQGPLQWHLVVTIGEPNDSTSDATMPWPDNRARIDVGTLTINHIEAEAPGNCRDVNFDPLVLPSGIEPSDDPLLSARSAAYSTSFRRRAGEPKTPSEVQVPPADKGN